MLVVIAGLSVASSLLLSQGVHRQSEALLRNNAGQINLLLQTSLSTLQSQLRATAGLTAVSGDSPTVFATQAAGLRTQPVVTVALVDSSGPTARVVLVAGTALQQGALPAMLAPVVHEAASGLAGAVVDLGGHKQLALAAAPTSNPHVSALELSPVDPTKPIPNRSGPYSHVYVNVYAGPTADPATLFLTTYGPRPLPGTVATATLHLGDVRWLIAVSQISSLVGGSAEAAPWIVLAVGLVVAFMAAGLVEILSRRQEYAQELVAMRTAELVETQRLAVRRERLAAIGEMASVVSHELRNPLSAVVNDLFLLRHKLGAALGEEGDRHLSNAENQVFRASRLSEDLLAYARDREPELAPVDFEAVVGAVLEATPPPDGVSVEVEGAARFQADQGLLTQVMTNLVTNAYQAMPSGGTVRLSATSDDGATVITVEDEGDGIDPAVTERLFDPFVTTKHEGTGLGLAIVRRLVTAHGGEVEVENRPDRGARFTIRLPNARS
ncbi:MAG TPA: HAMP domain-containing sensor histidine kinase [Acidimicrobiales bacterium]|nr:HAMP domain-containing sensor histidine kinase [Acidimicrobiales bacterium]